MYLYFKLHFIYFKLYFAKLLLNYIFYLHVSHVQKCIYEYMTKYRLIFFMIVIHAINNELFIDMLDVFFIIAAVIEDV